MTNQTQEITDSMIKTMVHMYHRQYHSKEFWAVIAPYSLSKDAYYGKGLLIQDIQKLTEFTYVTASNAVHRLVDDGYAEKMIGPSRDTFVLTEKGRVPAKIAYMESFQVNKRRHQENKE